jgi:hypothetical protein
LFSSDKMGTGERTELGWEKDHTYTFIIAGKKWKMDWERLHRYTLITANKNGEHEAPARHS